MTTKVISDASFREAPLLAQKVYGLSAQNAVIPVRDWTQFRNRLRRLSDVDKLVIYTHAGSGELILNGHHRSVGTLPEFLTEMPQIDEIFMEGCRFGADPAEMALFARIFRARKIHAYNQYHVSTVLRVDIPRGTVRESAQMREVRQRLRQMRPFFAKRLSDGADMQNAEHALEGRPGNYRIFCEWFRSDRSRAMPGPSAFGGPPRGLHPRDTADQTDLDTNDALPSESNAPVVRFQRVTVSLPAPAAETGAATPGATPGATPRATPGATPGARPGARPQPTSAQ